MQPNVSSLADVRLGVALKTLHPLNPPVTINVINPLLHLCDSILKAGGIFFFSKLLISSR